MASTNQLYNEDYIMKFNETILSLPTFKVRPPGQTQPLNQIVVGTVQDFLSIVRLYTHCVIEWKTGDEYPFLHYSSGTKWQRKPMTAELPFTLLQAGLIQTCHADDEVSKWRPIK